MTSFLGVPIDAAYHLVTGLTAGLTPVLGGLAAAAAVILLTMAVRLALLPLNLRAMRGMAAQARLAPQVQALRTKYAKRPERLRTELAALYRTEGVSAFGGFAPLLLQWPVFSVLYLLFRSARIAGGPNGLLGHRLLGVPLGSYWIDGPGVLSAHGAVFAGVLVLLAAACWLGIRAAKATASASASAPGQLPGALARVLPYLTVGIAAFAPLAAGIYLVTSTAWSAGERYLFRTRAR